MKVIFAKFSEPVLLPGGFNEKVIDLKTNRHHKARFDVELDARGFVRIRDTQSPGVLGFVGPTKIDVVHVIEDEPKAAASLKR